MKRFYILLTIICILATFAACEPKQTYNYVSPITNSEDFEPENEPITEILPVDQMPLVTVSLPLTTKTEVADDGTELLRYTYQNMFLIVPDSDVGNDVIIDFLNHRDRTDNIMETLLESAKNAYKTSSSWSPYICQIIYEPIRIDYGVLSLLGRNTVYNGSPHPETHFQSLNYDLVTGNALTLADIFTENTKSDTISTLVSASLKEIASDKQLYSGYETAVNERFTDDYLEDSDWYFSDTGLVFYFSPYEIAPYSSGVVSAVIPYENLTGLLNDAYFPAERESAAGTLYAELFSEDAAKKYTQFAEVVLDKNRDKTLLYTDHYIQNLRITSGSWSADGNTFTPENVVFAAYGLTVGDAVMLESELTASVPNIQISYVTGNNRVTVYLSGTPDTSVNLK